MNSTLNYFLFLFGIIFGGLFLNISIRLFFADKIESRKSAARVRSIKDSIMGRALVRSDWIPDPRIQHGLIFNKRKNRIEINGRMSRSIFNRVFR